MLDRIRSLTVTPSQYARVAWAAVIAFSVIVATGAAVRLSGSGLGCPHWPKCYSRVYPPLQSHALIEFSNRMITGPVTLAALLAFGLAFRRRPYRRDLVLVSAMLPLGVAAQAVLGGLTVRGALDYGWVIAHFALSMLILVAAVGLAWRASSGRGQRSRFADRTSVWLVRSLVPLGAVAILAGTAATAAGPHAGGAPGQKINRLVFDGRATMNFVIHRHGEIAFLFGLAAVGVWWWLGRRPLDARIHRWVAVLCGLMAAQGIVGYVQYQAHLPSELVWIHVVLVCAIWLSTLWAAASTGSDDLRETPTPMPRTRVPARAEVATRASGREEPVPVTLRESS